MKLKTAKAIIAMLELNGISSTLHKEYSGRGMHGETTAAISIEDPSYIYWACGKLNFSIEESNFSTDSLGFDTILY